MSNITTTDPDQRLPVTMGFNNLAGFEFMQRTAKMFSASTMVPTAYQAMITKGFGDRATLEPNPAALANCVIALDMSQRMNANPLMIMQNLHIIEGRPSWSSQFIIAAINNCGKFSPLRFDLQWLDEMDASYSTFEWMDRKKVEKKHTIRIKNARCVAWAIEKATGDRLESAPVTMEMAVAEGWFGKNGSKWKSMPDLMMRYRSAAFFGRIYAPELLMGLPAAEELHDVFSVEQDGSVSEARGQRVPPSTGTVDPDTGEVVQEPYPQADFEKNLPGWSKVISSGRKTLADLAAMVGSKAPLTDAQKQALQEAADKLQAGTVDNAAPAPSPAPEQPAAEPDPAPFAPLAAATSAITFAQVNTQLAAAKDLDALFIAADLIGEVADPQHRAELTAEFEKRQIALEQS